MKQRETSRINVPPIGNRLLTLREAAVLRLNPRTVQEYMRGGEIEGRLLGEKWRFRRQELDAVFENAPPASGISKDYAGD